MKSIQDKIIASGLFEETESIDHSDRPNNSITYQLSGTDYRVMIYLYDQDYSWYEYNQNFISWWTLEEVLDLLKDDAKINLLFHLDIFTGYTDVSSGYLYRLHRYL